MPDTNQAENLMNRFSAWICSNIYLLNCQKLRCRDKPYRC